MILFVAAHAALAFRLAFLQSQQVGNLFLILICAALQLLIINLRCHGTAMHQHPLTLFQGCTGLLGEFVKRVAGRYGSCSPAYISDSINHFILWAEIG